MEENETIKESREGRREGEREEREEGDKKNLPEAFFPALKFIYGKLGSVKSAEARSTKLRRRTRKEEGGRRRRRRTSTEAGGGGGRIWRQGEEEAGEHGSRRRRRKRWRRPGTMQRLSLVHLFLLSFSLFGFSQLSLSVPL